MYLSIRSAISALVATRIRRSTERAIFEKKVSTQFNQDACVGVNTSSKRSGWLAKKRMVSFERWAE